MLLVIYIWIVRVVTENYPKYSVIHIRITKGIRNIGINVFAITAWIVDSMTVSLAN